MDGAWRTERSQRDSVQPPFIHRAGTKPIVKPYRPLVPAEHNPFHPSAATFPGFAETMIEELFSVSAAPVRGENENILQEQCRAGEEGRVRFEEYCIANRNVFSEEQKRIEFPAASEGIPEQSPAGGGIGTAEVFKVRECVHQVQECLAVAPPEGTDDNGRSPLREMNGCATP